MALSFQEAEGCAAIWKFVNSVQIHLQAMSGPDDALSDDISMDPFTSSITLPEPTLGNLPDIEQQMRGLQNTQQGRENLTKYILNEDYIKRLIPLLEIAEDMEDLSSLHRLCNIMKGIILLNDNNVIEMAVTDSLILGVVGILEYDPDFPSHKANHRQWLSKEGRYNEVVRIDDPNIRRKIHSTYRLLYLKDVVLARILDDPTFSVLNSLIFFNQVDIVQYLHNSPSVLKELFGVFRPQEKDQERKKEAVLFIQQCCAIAKNLQQQPRQQLYNSFLGHGLLSVINYALRHHDVGVRVGATDVLVSMIDHDPSMVRQTIFRQLAAKEPPLTDSLIDLLLVEADYGVKAQVADAIKVLLDPGQNAAAGGIMNGRLPQGGIPDPQQIEFVKDFYDESAKKLFKPLVDIKDRKDMNFSVHQVQLMVYLIEILCFFVRQHTHHSKYFVLSEKLGQRIAQLLGSPEKYLKLTVLKFFRNLVGLQDEFYNQQMTQGKLFEPILDLVIETMPRDNLLNSACLELFDFIKRENINTLICHLVENYRDKLKQITYVDIFSTFITKYDQKAFDLSVETQNYGENENEAPKRPETGRGTRWDNGIREADQEQEEYFNTSDDEDEITAKGLASRVNSVPSSSKPLVDYPSDEEAESMETDTPDVVSKPSRYSKTASLSTATRDIEDSVPLTPIASAPVPPEKVSEKRRREEEDEDEMSKLLQPKRRNSSSSTGSNSSGGGLRRKKSFQSSSHSGSGHKAGKIAISLGTAIKTGGEGSGGSDSSG
jgi:protein phosphatase-4 regulatory subunit 3